MIRALFLVILTALFFVMSGFGDNVPEKTFPIIYNSTEAEEKSPDFDPAKFKTPFNLLRQACPKVFLHSGEDVKSATAHSSPAMPYMTEQKGWDKMIEVKIVLKDQLNTISKSFNANGHTLYYYIGPDGVFTDKRLAQQLCGWPVSENGDSMFKEIKGM